MVTDGDWKYIYTDAGGVSELYNQREDLEEVRNRAADQPDRAKAMADQLRACHVELNDTGLLDDDQFKVSPVDRESLRHLDARKWGYRWF